MNQPFFFDTTSKTSRERLAAMREKIEQAGLKEEAEVREVFGYSAEVLPDKVMDQALTSAAANGHVVLTELLAPYVSEYGHGQAFDMAINRGQPQTLALMLPWNHPNRIPNGMEAAIRKKNEPVFELLLPLVDPSLNDSHFLEIALICGNTPAAKQLMPFSAPWLFARKMRRDNEPNFEVMAALWTQSLMENGGPLPPPTRSVKLLLKLVPNVQSALRHIQLAQTFEATGLAGRKPRF